MPGYEGDNYDPYCTLKERGPGPCRSGAGKKYDGACREVQVRRVRVTGDGARSHPPVVPWRVRAIAHLRSKEAIGSLSSPVWLGPQAERATGFPPRRPRGTRWVGRRSGCWLLRPRPRQRDPPAASASPAAGAGPQGPGPSLCALRGPRRKAFSPACTLQAPRCPARPPSWVPAAWAGSTGG